MRLSATDVYAFRLQLMDILFTKEEQSSSLLFASKKSKRVGLDRERVDKLLGKLPFSLDVTMRTYTTIMLSIIIKDIWINGMEMIGT